MAQDAWSAYLINKTKLRVEELMTTEEKKDSVEEPPAKKPFKLAHMTPPTRALAQSCWRFLNAMEELPQGSDEDATRTPLEAYLLIAQATSQAALNRMNAMPFGDKGAHHLFPDATGLGQTALSDEAWTAFQTRGRDAMDELRAF
jgi:hypothetical protein